MMLYEVCSRMFSSGVKDGNHHTTLESFTKAAAEGCCICAPFLRDAIGILILRDQLFAIHDGDKD